MSEVPSTEGNGDSFSAMRSGASGRDEMDALRRLLIAPEQDRLEQANARLVALENRKTTVTTEELASLLPAAVIERSAQDGKLASALEPTIEETLRGSVRRNPQPIVDAIFPVIGPAIRRAIAEALSSTLESVNRTMEHQFSLQGLKWRFEAIRTGQEFSEVVLRNSLLYATDQLFVIHNETGLPLVYASRLADDAQDGSLVTSMLSVIQDFVRDSLGGDRSDSLESIEYGDLTILFEPGPIATLAAVIRGTPPRSVREDTQELIEEFHLRYRKEMEEYDGDDSAFEKTRPLLESALNVQMHESGGANWKTWLLLALLVLGLVAIGIFFVRAKANWNRFVGAVDDTSGIVVTEVARSNGARVVRGLRDPLSDDPAPLVESHGYSSESVRFEFEPFRALTEEMVSRRAAQSLNAPQSVAFTFEDQTLFATGAASHRWIEEARIRAAQLEDVRDYNDSALVDSDVQQIQQISEEIVSIPVRFEIGTLDSIQDLGLDRIAQLVNSGLDVAEKAGLNVDVVVRGFASSDGQQSVNERLAIGRAQSTAAQLVKLGVPTARIVIDRGGAAQPEARAILRILN